MMGEDERIILEVLENDEDGSLSIIVTEQGRLIRNIKNPWKIDDEIDSPREEDLGTKPEDG